MFHTIIVILKTQTKQRETIQTGLNLYGTPQLWLRSSKIECDLLDHEQIC